MSAMGSAYEFLLKNKAEQLVLQIIYNQLIGGGDMALKTVARDSHFSESAVTKLFVKWGFEGFREFRNQLLQEYGVLQVYQTGSKYFVEKNIMNKAITATMNANPEDVYEPFVSAILAAQHIQIVTMGGNHAIGVELCYRLSRLGLRVTFNIDPHATYTNLFTLQKEDAIICISYRGSTPELDKILRTATARQIPILAIVGNLQSLLAQSASQRLVLEDSEPGVRIFSWRSRVSMFYIVTKLSYLIYERKLQTDASFSIFSNIY